MVSSVRPSLPLSLPLPCFFRALLLTYRAPQQIMDVILLLPHGHNPPSPSTTQSPPPPPTIHLLPLRTQSIYLPFLLPTSTTLASITPPLRPIPKSGHHLVAKMASQLHMRTEPRLGQGAISHHPHHHTIYETDNDWTLKSGRVPATSWYLGYCLAHVPYIYSASYLCDVWRN